MVQKFLSSEIPLVVRGFHAFFEKTNPVTG